MKNWIIACLVVVLLFMASILYKKSQASLFDTHKLADHSVRNKMGDKILCLYLFLSYDSCPSCLDMIEELNEFKNPIIVKGVIPESEINKMEGIRRKYGIHFDIVSANKFKCCFPKTIPTLVGSTQEGEIVLVIPGVSGCVRYIREYIMSFYMSGFLTMSKS